MLKAGGQAVVVLPDNVLFEGGVGGNCTEAFTPQYEPAHDFKAAYRLILCTWSKGEERSVF